MPLDKKFFVLYINSEVKFLITYLPQKRSQVTINKGSYFIFATTLVSPVKDFQEV